MTRLDDLKAKKKQLEIKIYILEEDIKNKNKQINELQSRIVHIENLIERENNQ